MNKDLTPYTKEDYQNSSLLSMEKDYIIEALYRSNGRVEAAANMLKISVRTLHNKMPRHHLKAKYFKPNTNFKFESSN